MKRNCAYPRAAWHPSRLLGVLTAAVFLLAVLAPPVWAADALDQRQETITGSVGIPGGLQLAQVVAPALSGHLTRLALHLSNPSVAVDLTVSVQGVNALGEPDGVTRASTTLSLSPGSARWVELSFGAPAPVTAGSPYAVVLSPSASMGWSSASTMPYAGGKAWMNLDTWAEQKVDFVFRTYVGAGNTAPVGTPKGYETSEDTLLSVPAPGLLAGDQDAEGAALTAEVSQWPAHGTLGLQPDGSFTYLPGPDYNGSDAFTYRPFDGSLYGDPVPVELTVTAVNDAPALSDLPDRSLRWGESLAFAASAADPDQGERLTYQLDGPPGASIDPETGQFAWTPEKGQVGRHLLTVRVSDSGGLTDEESFTVQVLGRSVKLTYTGATDGQYSDAAVLAAVATDAETGEPLPGLAVSLSLDGESYTAVTDAEGEARQPVKLKGAAGKRSVGIALAENLTVTGDTQVEFDEHREQASLSYTGERMIPLTGLSAEVELKALLEEEADGHPGDLTLATVRFELYRAGSSTPELVVEEVPVSASGEATAAVTLQAGSWMVKASIPQANKYWQADSAGTATLSVGSSAGKVTGGGWILDSAGSKGHFSFTVQAAEGGQPKGNAQYSFRGADGLDYQVRAVALTGLSLDAQAGQAFFTATARAEQTDPATGQVLQVWEGISMSVHLRDGPDGYALVLLDGSGLIWHEAGGPLEGGQIRLHQK